MTNSAAPAFVADKTRLLGVNKVTAVVGTEGMENTLPMIGVKPMIGDKPMIGGKPGTEAVD